MGKIHTICMVAGLFAAGANASIFDFEGEIETSIGGAPFGDYTSLSIVDDGLEMTIYRSGGTPFDIIDLGPFGSSASWGSRSFDPFFDVSGPAAFIIINFSSSVTDFSIDFGDLGADEDEVFVSGWTGLDGTGDLVDVTDDFLDPTDDIVWTDGSLSLSGELSSVIIESVSDFPNSLYLDNIFATAVPSPSALAILGLGGLCGARRRRA